MLPTKEKKENYKGKLTRVAEKIIKDTEGMVPFAVIFAFVILYFIAFPLLIIGMILDFFKKKK